mgnify:CR=1 FL=1
MLGNILSTGEQVLILVVLLAVGFLCGKIRIFNDQSISHLSAFALKIVGPCAIVESFCRQFDSAMLRAMGIVALLAFAAHALYAAFAYVCIRGGKEPTRRVLRYGTVFANCGYMGLPLQQVLFGADGVFYGATWIGVYNLVAWSFGLVLMSGDRRQISFKKLLHEPRHPRRADRHRDLCVLHRAANDHPAAHPLFQRPERARSHGHQRLLSLEGRLAHHLEARELLHHHRLASCRHPAVRHRADVPAAEAFRLDGMLLAACIVDIAAPVAAATTMFSTLFRQDSETAANLVSISTLLSVLTLPIMVALAQSVFL